MIPVNDINRMQNKLSTPFKDLINFFNDLETKLEYPNCEGDADRERILIQAEKELIMWGKI